MKVLIPKELDKVIHITPAWEQAWHDLKYGIENLIRWFPVIWKDRDWHYGYVYVLLHHKLSSMENVISDGPFVNSRKYGERIRYCKLLLKRLTDENYHDIAFMYHYKKWGEPEMDFVPIDDEFSEMVITYPNRITAEDKKWEGIEHRICMKNEQFLEKQDREQLFAMLDKYIANWWD